MQIAWYNLINVIYEIYIFCVGGWGELGINVSWNNELVVIYCVEGTFVNNFSPVTKFCLVEQSA